MHIPEGHLKAYLDRESDAERRRQIQEHLSGCNACRELVESLAARSERVSQQLAGLAPTSQLVPQSPKAARARLQSRISNKETSTMWKKIFARQFRMAWIALGLILILGVALAFPSVQAIANSFLGLFRVQQFTVVEVNPGNLPSQLGSATQLEYMLTNDVQVLEKGEPQAVENPARASELAGMTVRMPTQIEGVPELMVLPGSQATFNVNMVHIQALLEEIGRSDIRLPEDLDGATVTVDIHSGVTAMYGECEFDPPRASQDGYDPDDQEIPRLPRCTTLVQMPSPSISAPAGLDIAGIGEAFLQVLGMSAEEAAQFSRNIDWTTTFVIPIPRYSTTYREVSVDGVQGTLIQPSQSKQIDQYLLVWVKDGNLYSLTGPGSARTALSIANSLK